MKAWRIGTFGIEKLELAELAVPKPGPGQVLVRVHAVSLNYRDLLMVKGHYNPRLARPRIPCSDGAGEVVEVGEGVSSLKAGDRVAGIFMQNWLDGRPTQAKQKGALGGDIDGMLAEYVALPEQGVVRFPAALSFEEGATLPCAGVTAWNGLLSAHVKPGDTVLIQGTGGVSIFALQFAKLLGARVLAISGHEEKLERAKRLGVNQGCNYHTVPEWSDWVLEQTGGEGVEAVIEVGGAATLPQSLKAARVGGTVAQIGVLTGVEQVFQIVPILHKQLNVKGIYVGSRADFETMNRAVESTGLRPVVDRVFELGEAREALATLEAGVHFGKLVIRVAA
jgi:NADPH:quinone reductase-like Zn-dependent oxidoreductase